MNAIKRVYNYIVTKVETFFLKDVEGVLNVFHKVVADLDKIVVRERNSVDAKITQIQQLRQHNESSIREINKAANAKNKIKNLVS